MDPTNETYWNALHAIAWIALRDREYLLFIGEGSLLREFTSPEGETRRTNVPGPPGLTHLEAMAAARGSPYGSIDDAEAGLIERLAAGALLCWGRKSGQGDLREIPAVEWAELTFREGRRGDICAANGSRWTGLRFRREDVLALWPDLESPVEEQPSPKAPVGRPTYAPEILAAYEALVSEGIIVHPAMKAKCYAAIRKRVMKDHGLASDDGLGDEAIRKTIRERFDENERDARRMKAPQ